MDGRMDRVPVEVTMVEYHERFTFVFTKEEAEDLKEIMGKIAGPAGSPADLAHKIFRILDGYSVIGGRKHADSTLCFH